MAQQEYVPHGFQKAEIPEGWYEGKTVTGCNGLHYAEDHETIVANFTGGNGLFTFDL